MAKNDKDSMTPLSEGQPGGEMAAAPVKDLAAMVEQWFREFIPNSPASRTTESYNHLYRAKEVLQARLKGE